MIRINKSLLITDTPDSLKPACREFFAPRNISRTAKTTTKRRHELIRNRAYIDNDKFNARYKTKDIKSKLKTIYENKCAYCEQKVEQFHVEHYRPKQTYYWLAYSWDNLISACSYCNEFKGMNFDINGGPATFTVNLQNIKAINNSLVDCDAIETPDLVNPEITDPTGSIEFEKDGNITSALPRFDYTIRTCKIHRTYLNDGRRKLLDDLREDLKAVFTQYSDKDKQETAIETIVNKFRRDATNLKNEFIAFRNFVINNWLAEELKTLTK